MTGAENVGVFYTGKVLALKIAWANQKEGNGVGPFPSRETGCGRQ
jgi:hypothetical protein